MISNISSLDVYLVGVPIIVGLITFELIVASWNKLSLYRREDSLASIGLLLGNLIVSALVKGLILAFSFYLYQFRLVSLNQILSPLVLLCTTIVAIDLVFYIYHRCSHRSRFLWAIHMNHHSSQEMNFLVAFRQAWFGPVSKIPFFAVLPIIGFDPSVTLVAGVMSTLWGVVGHTQIVKSLGPFEWFLNTPSHHRVHHGSNPEYIDKNYGNIFIIWDKLFATFEPERADVVYGLVNNVKTFNPIRITFMAWQSLRDDMFAAATIKESISFFFAPPGWQPSEQFERKIKTADKS